jgi:hypothetical protein
VCVKHPGKDGNATAPIWFNATILSESETAPDKNKTNKKKKSLELLVRDPIFRKEWTVTVPRGCLLNEIYTASANVVPSKFEKALCRLARDCKYFDYSFPTGREVLVRDGGGERKALALDWREFNWEAFLESESSSSSAAGSESPAGAYVAVLFQDEKLEALVARTRVDEELASRIEEQAGHLDGGATEKTAPGQPMPSSSAQPGDDPQRAALLKSIELSGKVVCDAQTLFGTRQLSCYWPDEDEWYPAEPLDPTTVSFEIIATHCLHTLDGVYCPLHFEDDSSYVVPQCYIRKQTMLYRYRFGSR